MLGRRGLRRQLATAIFFFGINFLSVTGGNVPQRLSACGYSDTGAEGAQRVVAGDEFPKEQ